MPDIGALALSVSVERLPDRPAALSAELPGDALHEARAPASILLILDRPLAAREYNWRADLIRNGLVDQINCLMR